MVCMSLLLCLYCYTLSHIYHNSCYFQIKLSALLKKYHIFLVLISFTKDNFKRGTHYGFLILMNVMIFLFVIARLIKEIYLDLLSNTKTVKNSLMLEEVFTLLKMILLCTLHVFRGFLEKQAQQGLTCSGSTVETIKQSVKSVQS